MNIATQLEKELDRTFYYAVVTTLDNKTFKAEFFRRDTDKKGHTETYKAWVDNNELSYQRIK